MNRLAAEGGADWGARSPRDFLVHSDSTSRSGSPCSWCHFCSCSLGWFTLKPVHARDTEDRAPSDRCMEPVRESMFTHWTRLL